ncbi:MAG: hypothetical protein IJ946_06835 [Clostridia bacterium]|nr:hypothetical protein [Clostridia bacterium]
MKVTDLYKIGYIMSGIDTYCDFLSEDKADELFFINRALADLNINPITSITDSLELRLSTADAVSAGIAYYLSLYSGDSDRTAFLCELYNAKRASALSQITRVKCSKAFKG